MRIHHQSRALAGIIFVVAAVAGCGSNRPPTASAPNLAGTGTVGAASAGGAIHDLCSAIDPRNDDRDHATPIPFAVKVQGCLQTASDVDYYLFTTPASPMSGGVVSVALTDVSAGEGTGCAIWSIADGDQIVRTEGLNGDSVYSWFDAIPNAKYAVEIGRMTRDDPIAYSLEVKFTPVNDSHESNRTREQAASVSMGVPVKGQLFAGAAGPASASSDDWNHWYKFTLVGSTVTVVLTDVPSDITSNLALYDALGARLAIQSSPIAGGGIRLEKKELAPGDYYVSVSPFVLPDTHGTNKLIPKYASQKYTLTVTP